MTATRDPRGVGNGPVAGRFVLLIANDDSDAPDWNYVTSWDTWEECEVAFPIKQGFKLRDDETGLEWLANWPYEREAHRKMRLRAREGSWGDSYEEAMLRGE